MPRSSYTSTRQSPRQWQELEHTPRELEHRLTSLEWTTEKLSEQHDQHRDTHSKHDQRLSLIERAILGLAGAVYILAQEKFPFVAQLLKGILP